MSWLPEEAFYQEVNVEIWFKYQLLLIWLVKICQNSNSLITYKEWIMPNQVKMFDTFS